MQNKTSFFAPEIEYLGYMLTKDGIKPVQKKVQAVLDFFQAEDGIRDSHG